MDRRDPIVGEGRGPVGKKIVKTDKKERGKELNKMWRTKAPLERT